MRPVLSVLVIVVTGLLFLKLLVVFLEPRLTFFPSREIRNTPADAGIAFKEHFLETADGCSLNAWYLPNPDSNVDLIYFHGNAGNLSTGRVHLLGSFHAQGYSVFAFDYRGYGKSSGSPSERGLLEDSRAAVDFYWNTIQRRPKTVVYMGQSLGGFTAAFAASIRLPDALVLEATFPDKRTLLRHYPLFRVLSLFSRYDLSTVSYLREVSCPILVIHGDADKIVPFAVGQELFDQLPQTNKEFYRVKGADHGDQYIIGGAQYWARLKQFVDALPAS